MADERQTIWTNPKDIANWALGHWQASLGAVGCVAEAAAYIGKEMGGPAWLSYGHVLFLLLVGAGAISSASAKKVTDLENRVASLGITKADSKPADK